MSGFLKLCGAAALALGLGTGASTAAPVDLNFVSGGFSGTFYGLDDAIIGAEQNATGFDVSGALDDYVLTDLSSATSNKFMIFGVNDFTIDFSLFALLLGNDAQGTLETLRLVETGGTIVERPVMGSSSPTTTSGPVFFFTSPVAPVPLPAGALLLLSGGAVLAGFKRRRARNV